MRTKFFFFVVVLVFFYSVIFIFVHIFLEQVKKGGGRKTHSQTNNSLLQIQRITGVLTFRRVEQDVSCCYNRAYLSGLRVTYLRECPVAQDKGECKVWVT